jgi:hypothetical protein
MLWLRSFPVLFEAQPPRTGFVSGQSAPLSQPCARTCGSFARWLAPGRNPDSARWRRSSQSPQPPTQELGEPRPETFRITPQPRSHEPSAAASFNPGM